jgi:putative two-component system response regulator
MDIKPHNMPDEAQGSADPSGAGTAPAENIGPATLSVSRVQNSDNPDGDTASQNAMSLLNGGTLTRILVVDDEKRILQTFQLMFSDSGYQIKTAASAEEALRLLAGERFDLAFLDCYIGRDRGLDLMQRLAAVDPGLYFVMITANGNTDLAVEALKRGASDFITKPFFIADIVKSINYVDRKRELDRQKRELLQTLETKVQERTQELEAVYVDVLSSLAQVLETRDFSTFGHCKRVSHYSRLIADEMGLSPEDKHYLEIAALLHDVGKVGISDSILLKPAALDKDEWANLKHHPAKGVEILKPLKYLGPALPAILHHHEFFNGSGYPDGLKGEDIPLNARIIAVVDAWDVMRSDRPYRKALCREAATKELLVFSGVQFDPALVEILIRLA